jgi:hypothetical protein
MWIAISAPARALIGSSDPGGDFVVAVSAKDLKIGLCQKPHYGMYIRLNCNFSSKHRRRSWGKAASGVAPVPKSLP